MLWEALEERSVALEAAVAASGSVTGAHCGSGFEMQQLQRLQVLWLYNVQTQWLHKQRLQCLEMLQERSATLGASLEAS